ncbi:MAG: hypothetical protein LBQ30_02705, partial [Treponema sp.]|nr:hypothetical protein [Treponema sp.]
YGNYGFKLVREDPIAPPDILNYTMIRNSALIRGPRPSRAAAGILNLTTDLTDNTNNTDEDDNRV